MDLRWTAPSMSQAATSPDIVSALHVPGDTVQGDVTGHALDRRAGAQSGHDRRRAEHAELDRALRGDDECDRGAVLARLQELEQAVPGQRS